MGMRTLTAALGAVAAMAGALASTSAVAGVTVNDTYYGGTNYYNDAPPVSGDVIGSSTFDTHSAHFERSGGTLIITINTNYVFAPETGNSLGTGYGALFLNDDPWTPQGSGPEYHTDTYQPGDWKYAVTMPFNPGLGNTFGSSGLYLTSTGTIGMSHVGASYSGGSFRNNQAVEFFAGGGPIGAASWSTSAGKITFNINDGGLLGNNLAFSWAMTCANDVIQGQVAGIPEPATWGLMILGFGAVGAMIRRRRGAFAA